MKGKFKNLTCKEKALIGAGIGNIVLASLLVLIVLGVPIAQVNSVQQTTPTTSQGFSTLLLVKAYDKDGNLIAERAKEGDLWLRNWGKFLQLLFNPDSGTTTSLTAIDGSSRIIEIRYWGSNDNIIFSEVGDGSVRVVIGSGTTSVSVDDYNLANQVAEATVSSPSLSVSGNSMNITFSASFTLDTATDVSESGVKMLMEEYEASNNDKWILLIRDTFDAVSVPAGGTITITYIIRLNQ